jgi:hypothetical protein
LLCPIFILTDYVYYDSNKGFKGLEYRNPFRKLLKKQHLLAILGGVLIKKKK